jgi:hypothetical protein
MRKLARNAGISVSIMPQDSVIGRKRIVYALRGKDNALGKSASQ